jgi:pimeloyl-ACP methyl ester carboxylesterase
MTTTASGPFTVELPGAGHLLSLERPARFNGHLLGFLA